MTPQDEALAILDDLALTVNTIHYCLLEKNIVTEEQFSAWKEEMDSYMETNRGRLRELLIDIYEKKTAKKGK